MRRIREIRAKLKELNEREKKPKHFSDLRHIKAWKDALLWVLD